MTCSGGTITKIEVQKRRPRRRSIFLDDEFRFGLDEEIVIKHGLRIGQVLDTGRIETILLEEERKKAKQYALQLLSYRDRSRREMKERLERKGYEKDIVQSVIGSLEQVGLLDDRRFAADWGRERLLNRPMGSRLLALELRKKGIADEIVRTTIDEMYPGGDEHQQARLALQSRRSRYQDTDPDRRKQRLSGFLSRRGFSWSVIRDVLVELQHETNGW